MGAFIDLTGMKFGRLVVLGLAYKKPRKRGGYAYYWRCRCECGKEKIVCGECLRGGNTKSCGCLREDFPNRTTHGLVGTTPYNIWLNIKQRCLNPNNKDYKDYGARGITIYEPWINDFLAFYEYVSTLEHFNEPGYTLDRKDNNGNYEPGNLRWATPAEQGRNKRNNYLVEYDGRKMTLMEASELSGISYTALLKRYHCGDRGDRLFRPVKH